MAHLISAGALVRDSRVLLGRRVAGRRYFPDCWDLPGGHIEPGEDPAQALDRELREELGIDAEVSGTPSLHVEHQPDLDDGMVMGVWTVTRWSGEPKNLAEDEHDELRWVDLEEIQQLNLAHHAYRQLFIDLLTTSE
jgi:mutator protein MutT